MAINKFITIQQSLADLKDETGIDSTLSTPKLNRLVTRCLSKLVGKSMLVPFICNLKFDGYNLELPENAVLIEGMIWGNYGNNCFNLFDNFCNSSFAFNNVYSILIAETSGVSDTNYNYGIYGYNISDNVMQFSNDYKNNDITVKCWGYKIECDHILYPEA